MGGYAVQQVIECHAIAHAGIECREFRGENKKIPQPCGLRQRQREKSQLDFSRRSHFATPLSACVTRSPIPSESDLSLTAMNEQRPFTGIGRSSSTLYRARCAVAFAAQISRVLCLHEFSWPSSFLISWRSGGRRAGYGTQVLILVCARARWELCAAVSGSLSFPGTNLSQRSKIDGTAVFRHRACLPRRNGFYQL